MFIKSIEIKYRVDFDHAYPCQVCINLCDCSEEEANAIVAYARRQWGQGTCPVAGPKVKSGPAALEHSNPIDIETVPVNLLR